ncbi:MAG: site-specific DNA-methyltransferase [Comamonadaceae bacterium]|jgi:hypothetical protein|nr:site-specific DNA-methyltransferase [Comamonadaceae bacterium]
MRHPLHSICPYFAMFPEDFVAKQVLAYTKRGDWVFDPFSGRGTTVFESLLNGRHAAGTDINPVAACVAGAKADAPGLRAVLARVNELESVFKRDEQRHEQPPTEFFSLCFHEETYAEICFLRSMLCWKESKTDRFIAAVILGCLHGESHKTPNCLSNRMPRTISTKPQYSVDWWRQRNLVAPRRMTFDILRAQLRYRLQAERPGLKGAVRHRDARDAGRAFPSLREKVSLVVTSPPYLDTTDYNEDQWLRLWFLGGAAAPHAGANKDDRHTTLEGYWSFLNETWEGMQPLLKDGAHIVIRIGGTKLDKQDLLDGLQISLMAGLERFRVKPMHDGLTTPILNRQTNVFRPGTSPKRYEHDFTFRVAA